MPVQPIIPVQPVTTTQSRMNAGLRMLSNQMLTRVKLIVWILCLLPVLRLLVGALTGQLGTNPIELITRSTGTWTLVFLCCTLAITPLRQITGWIWLLKLRRLLGLFVYFYVCLHLTTWVWFDQWFDINDMIKDVIKRPFITIGMAAFLLLTPLALTSNKLAMKRLGRRWGLLHKLVYVIGILAVVHYWWLVKKDLTQPIIYALVIGALLGWRLWKRGQRG